MTASQPFDQLARTGLPVLQVLRKMDDRTDLFPFASFDYATGSIRATRHLLEQGARTVAFVGGLPVRAISGSGNRVGARCCAPRRWTRSR